MPESNWDGTQLFESIESILKVFTKITPAISSLRFDLFSVCFHILPPQIKEHLFNSSVLCALTALQTGIASSQASSPLALLLRTMLTYIIALLHSFTCISFFQFLQLLVNISVALFMSYCFTEEHTSWEDIVGKKFFLCKLSDSSFWYRECRYILHMNMHQGCDAESLHIQ